MTKQELEVQIGGLKEDIQIRDELIEVLRGKIARLEESVADLGRCPEEK